MTKRFNSFQKVLIFLSVVIVLSIITITIINTNKTLPVQSNKMKTPVFTESPFLSFGQIRISTSDTPAVPVVIKLYIPYSNDDVPFFEELNQKMPKLKKLIATYFSQRTREQLTSSGEETVKADLIKEFNNELILGNISEIYFSEYIFLE